MPCKSNADNDLCSSYKESNIIGLVYYVVLIFESADSLMCKIITFINLSSKKQSRGHVP